MQAQIIKAVLSQALLFGIKDALEACKQFFFSVLGWATKHETNPGAPPVLCRHDPHARRVLQGARLGRRTHVDLELRDLARSWPAPELDPFSSDVPAPFVCVLR
jgi:hypothetical protein